MLKQCLLINASRQQIFVLAVVTGVLFANPPQLHPTFWREYKVKNERDYVQLASPASYRPTLFLHKKACFPWKMSKYFNIGGANWHPDAFPTQSRNQTNTHRKNVLLFLIVNVDFLVTLATQSFLLPTWNLELVQLFALFMFVFPKTPLKSYPQAMSLQDWNCYYFIIRKWQRKVPTSTNFKEELEKIMKTFLDYVPSCLLGCCFPILKLVS